MILKFDATDVITYFKLVDPTDGTPETGLTVTDLDLTYVRDQAAAVKNDALAHGAVTDAHTDLECIEVDSTNCPGLYRVDWPDAAFATGVKKVQLCVNGAAIDPAYIEVELWSIDPADGVRAGITALPNAAAEAAGGLYTRGSGAGQINQSQNGSIYSDLYAIQTVVQSATDLKDFVDTGYDPTLHKVGEVAVLTGHTAQTGDTYAALPTNFGDLAITSTTGKVTVGTNDDKTGYSLAADQSGVTIGTVSALTGHTAQTGDTYAALPTNFGDLAITSTTGKVTVGTNDDKTGYSLAADQSGVTIGTVSTLTGHTVQTGDSYAIVNSGTYGNAQLVRATTPANALDVNATGEAGIDLDNTSGTLAKTTDITGFNDIAAADVNAQVLDVLNTDTFAEPGQEAPAATNTLVAKIGYLFKMLRNKIETTATLITVYNDDGTTAGQKSTISDDGTTFSRGEFGTGA